MTDVGVRASILHVVLNLYATGNTYISWRQLFCGKAILPVKEITLMTSFKISCLEHYKKHLDLNKKEKKE